CPEYMPRNSAQLRHRRVIRVNADAYASLLGHRRNLLDEVSVRPPKFFFRILTTMRQRTLINLPIPVTLGRLKLERPPPRSGTCGLRRPRPDPIRHVRISNVTDTRLASISNILLQPFDFLITPRQSQRDFFNIPIIIVRNIPELESRGFHALF